MLEKGVLRYRLLLSGGATWHGAGADAGKRSAFPRRLEFAVDAFAKTKEELK